MHVLGMRFHGVQDFHLAYHGGRIEAQGVIEELVTPLAGMTVDARESGDLVQ